MFSLPKKLLFFELRNFPALSTDDVSRFDSVRISSSAQHQLHVSRAFRRWHIFARLPPVACFPRFLAKLCFPRFPPTNMFPALSAADMFPAHSDGDMFPRFPPMTFFPRFPPVACCRALEICIFLYGFASSRWQTGLCFDHATIHISFT